MTVLESYIISEAEISGVEEFNDHRVKTDGAVVSLVAVPSGDEDYGATDNNTDTSRVLVVGQIEGVDEHVRVDAATATMIGIASASVEHAYAPDAATVTLIGVPSGSDSVLHGPEDAATVTMVSEAVAGADEYGRYDQHTVRLTAVMSALDEHNYPPDAATVTLIGVPSGSDLLAKWYEDAATLTWVADLISATDTKHGISDGTITLTAVPSALDVMGTVDAATVTLTAVPSGDDFMAHWYEDAATLTHTGIPSGLDSIGYAPDAATVTEIHEISGVDQYLPAPVAGDYQAYIGFISTSRTDYVVPTGGGGASWTVRATDSNGAAHARVMDDTNLAGHQHTDFPELHQTFTGGDPTDAYTYIVAMGDTSAAGNVFGMQYSFNGNGDNPNNNSLMFFDHPNGGDRVFIFWVVSEGGTINGGTGPDSYGYTLLDSQTFGTITAYLYTKVYGSDGHDDRQITGNMTGTNIHWQGLMVSYTSPTAAPYILDQVEDNELVSGNHPS